MKPFVLCKFLVTLGIFFMNYPTAQAEGLVIMVDTDRNGTISFQEDATGKNDFTPSRGAVVFPNNNTNSGNQVPDHSDSVVNGLDDINDLAPILIQTIPTLPQGVNFTASIDSASVPFTRLFLRTGTNNFTALTWGSPGNIPGNLVRDGQVELRLEANSHPTPSWTGRMTVTIAATNSSAVTPSSDSVVLQATPFLISPGTAPATELYVRAATGRNENFISQLQALAPAAGITIRISPASDPYQTNDVWMQDAFEPGFTQGAGRWRNVVLRSNRGSGWLLSNFAQDRLLAPDFGWITVGSFRSTFGGGSAPNGWLDWFGNLEVTPPLPNFPHGRIYYGVNGANSLDPTIVNFLNAQGFQGPALGLDVGWLLIKHVDEMACWIPSGQTTSPWRLLVPDTTAMAQLLDTWVAAGHGSRPLLQTYYSGVTVSSMANNTTQRNLNINLQNNRINPAIEAMKTGFGLTEADIIRVPSWYTSSGASYVPSMVNAALVNGHLLVSDPVGPVVNGVDLLQQDFRNRLAGTPLTIHFLDDEQYHKWSGNVHCATNVRRQPQGPEIYPTNAPTSEVQDWSLYQQSTPSNEKS
jgi:protein-arginine deiminase